MTIELLEICHLVLYVENCPNYCLFNQPQWVKPTFFLTLMKPTAI